MSALILQKPNKTSKAQLMAVKRRLQIWDGGNITELLTEGYFENVTKHVTEW